MGAFTCEDLGRGTHVIHGSGADAYVIEGKDEAIMVDAGMDHENIRLYAEGLIKKPVRAVVNTHSHFDHTGGNGFFDTVFATRGSSLSAKNTMGEDPRLFPLDYSFTYISDGDMIGPADRKLRVIMLDCHSPENIALLDIEGRQLLPGDETEAGQVLLLPGYAEKTGQLHSRPAATVETYSRQMNKLLSLSDLYDRILPAHNGTPIGIDVLERLIRLSDAILGGLEGKSDCSSPSYNADIDHFPLDTAHYRRAELDGVSLIYCADLVFDRDIENDQPKPATRLHEICSRCI